MLLLGAVQVGCSAAPPQDKPQPAGSARVVNVTAAPSAAASTRPTDRWAGAKPVVVGGGEILGCRGERSSDWLRVTCDEEANVFGRAPSFAAVSSEHIDKGIAEAEVRDDGATVALRWTPGADVVATFNFDGTPVILLARWPAGGPEPEVGARFRGVPDFSASDLARELCKCDSLYPPDERDALCENSELGALYTSPLECLRGPADVDSIVCASWQLCARSSPSGSAVCLPEEVHTGHCPSCACSLACGPDQACPPGLECTESHLRKENVCTFSEP